jgi:hypothetical protein
MHQLALLHLPQQMPDIAQLNVRIDRQPAAQISVPVIGLPKARATAAQWRPRFNHGTSFLASDIGFVTTAGFINLVGNCWGNSFADPGVTVGCGSVRLRSPPVQQFKATASALLASRTIST